jgi:hypothetical protein
VWKTSTTKALRQLSTVCGEHHPTDNRKDSTASAVPAQSAVRVVSLGYIGEYRAHAFPAESAGDFINPRYQLR